MLAIPKYKQAINIKNIIFNHYNNNTYFYHNQNINNFPGGGYELRPAPVSRKKAKELIIKAEDQLNALKVQGIKLETTNELLQNTKKAFEAKKLDETISNLNSLGSKLAEIKKYSAKFSELILVCHKHIKQAVVMKIEVEEFRDIIEKANDLFDDEHFSEAIALSKDCKQQLINAQFLLVSEKIKDIYNQLKELPKNILNSKGIQQRFNDADAAIKNDDFNMAWTIINQLLEICDDIMRPYLEKIQALAKDKIIEFQNDIEHARGRGVDLADAKEIFSEMVERMKNASKVSEFREIIEYTNAGKHALERALRRKERMTNRTNDIRAKMEPVMADFQDLQTYCAVPNSVVKLVNSLQHKFDSQDYDGAVADIEELSKKMNKLRKASEPKIVLKIQTEQLKSDLWNRTKLQVSNKGLASATKVKIRFSGPLEVRRITVVDSLDYNCTEIIEFGLRPEGAGSLPIDVDLEYSRSWDGKEYHEHQELWLDVVAVGPDGVGTRKSLKPGQIPYCQDAIKKSEPIYKCGCGVIYHLDCITYLDICIKCGTDLRQKVKNP
jgi:hypothetical protein